MNTKSLVILSLLIIGLISSATKQKQLFVNYGNDAEGIELFKYFHNVYAGFYVDIGAYDSIFASNTLNLKTMGWQGINIDASPDRLPRFFQLRKGQTNINYAVGEQSKMMSFYEIQQDDSTSTVSQKVKEKIQRNKIVSKQIKVPSISLKSLCQRFYNRKPIFMNLDVEGYEAQVLLSNDWNNSRCVPEIIFSQNSQGTKQSNLSLPQKMLTERGYKKVGESIGLNQVFIHESVQEKYLKAYEQGTKLISQKQVTNLSQISYGLANHLKVKTRTILHYDPQTDDIYYHFAQANQSVNILKINQFSNELSLKKNRPVAVINFSPSSSYLIVPNQNYSSETISIKNNNYTHLTIRLDNGQNVHAYIFNHYENSKMKPKILITNTTFKLPPSKKLISQISNVHESVKDLSKYIKGSFDALNEIKRQNSLAFGQTEAKHSKAKQQVTKSLDNLAKKKVQFPQPAQMKRMPEVVRNEVLLFILTFLVFFTVILVICLSSESGKKNRDYEVEDENNNEYSYQESEEYEEEITQHSQVSQVSQIDQKQHHGE